MGEERQKEIMQMVSRLQAYWLQHPELRLGQLVSNLTPNTHSTFYIPDVVIKDELTRQLKTI